jgi:flavin reductase (DIM6/NTAB) family NADH-FMN oxidoreductase RutF
LRSGAAPPVEAGTYRRLLSQFASGVAVATTLDGAGRPCGMTASAIAAVSLSPPLLLMCVNHEATFHAALSAAPRFALSVLSETQESLSRRFASELEDKFAGVRYRLGSHGLPLLDGALAHIVCDKTGAEVMGDHTVFVGVVINGEVFPGKPLLHFRSGYTTTLEQ